MERKINPARPYLRFSRGDHGRMGQTGRNLETSSALGHSNPDGVAHIACAAFQYCQSGTSAARDEQWSVWRTPAAKLAFAYGSVRNRCAARVLNRPRNTFACSCVRQYRGLKKQNVYWEHEKVCWSERSPVSGVTFASVLERNGRGQPQKAKKSRLG